MALDLTGYKKNLAKSQKSKIFSINYTSLEEMFQSLELEVLLISDNVMV